MRIAAQFRPDLAPHEAYAASVRVWLVGVIVWLAEISEACASPTLRALARAALAQFAPQLRAELRDTVRDLRRVLFLHAFVRLALRAQAPCSARPDAAPSGFRVRRRRAHLRALFGEALRGFNTGSLIDRARRLKRLLDNPEPVIARIVARLKRIIGRLRTTQFVLVASVTDRLGADAPALASAYADTS